MIFMDKIYKADIDRCFQTNDLRISLVRDNGISIIDNIII